VRRRWRELTPVNRDGQLKPFVYLNCSWNRRAAAATSNASCKQKNPALRRDFPKTHRIGWAELAVRLVTGILVTGILALPLTIGILLLLARFLAAALLLAGLLARILMLLSRLLVRVVLVRIGHSGGSLVE
jgi:hypothetical protein